MHYPHTVNGIQLKRLDLNPQRTAYFRKIDGEWKAVSTHETYLRSRALGMGLETLGLRPGTKVAIVSNTRPEWLLIDAATLSFGGVVVGIYPTSTAEQVAYILEHSESSLVFLENPDQLKRIMPFLEGLPLLRHLILLDGALEGELPLGAGGQPIGLHTAARLMQAGESLARDQPEHYRTCALAVQPEDVATLVYTSGTTGNPKGAILTHRNFYETVMATRQVFALAEHEVSLIFLPMAHVFQRFIAYIGMEAGGTGYFVEKVEQVQEAMQEVHPTTLAMVPRVLEKIQARILSSVAALPPLRQKIFAAAMKVGARRAAIPRGQPVPLWLELAYTAAARVVFSKVKQRLGGKVTQMISGSAPLSPAISEFFQAMGILVIEGYGLTETTAPCTTNTADDYRFGTVGKALPGTELKIAADGEILIRGPGVFVGYYKNEAATREALQDGWFHSGDIGRLDPDGFLRITDRKKDLIITSGGKNIGPQELENRLKQHPLISNALLYGDKRPYLVALLTLDEEELRASLGDSTSSFSLLVQHPQTVATVAQLIADFNAKVAPYETVKRYHVLEEDFSIERGELTPTLKLKRRVLNERHAALIARLYEG